MAISYSDSGVDVTRGYKAVELLKNDSESCAVGIRQNKIVTVPFEEVFEATKNFDNDLYNIAHVLSL